MNTPLIPQSRAARGYVALCILVVLCLSLGCIPSLQSYFAWLTPPVALFLGLLCAAIFGTPYAKFNSRASKQLLQWSVVGLGFGMNLQESLSSGAGGMSVTIVSVFGTLALGVLLGRLLGLERKISYLIGSGTAICGGSAIAAVGPTIDADERDMSVALGAVFVLNAIALFIFPPIGRYLELSQNSFGTWAAIAIHDTSSVVGAGAAYGDEALQTATMIKLTRALWIIPLAFVSSLIFSRGGSRVRIPWFIAYFVLAMIVNTYFLQEVSPELSRWISSLARRGMMLAMFFIGASLSWSSLRGIGAKPFVLAIVLWVIISISSLLGVFFFA